MWYKGSHSFTCHQTRAIPAFTPQSQSITALWPVLIAPTHRGMARLSWPETVGYKQYPRKQNFAPYINFCQTWDAVMDFGVYSDWIRSISAFPVGLLHVEVGMSGLIRFSEVSTRHNISLGPVSGKRDMINTIVNIILLSLRLKVPSKYITLLNTEWRKTLIGLIWLIDKWAESSSRCPLPT